MPSADNILLTTAGGGNANNVIRSLRVSGRKLKIIGTNINRYELAKSLADKNYLVPRFYEENYVSTIKKIIKKENIHLLIPNHEQEALAIANVKDELKTNTFIPKKETIELCINKYKFAQFLEKNKINVAPTIQVKDDTNICGEINKLKSHPKGMVWCRIKEGAGSRGAAPFKTAEEIKFWIKYWVKYKNFNIEDFILSEYLPGRDYMFFSLWNKGKLVVGKTCERLSYTCSKYALSGTSSSPSVGRLVNDKKINNICTKAVQKIDSNARGIFAIDLKENREGEPCLTEINIARFPRINIFFNYTGKYNLAEVYLKLGLGEDINFSEVIEEADEEIYLIRDFDHEPLIIREKDIESSFEIL